MHFKRFLACTLIAASLCAGVTGCVKKGESNADPTESSAVESSTEGAGTRTLTRPPLKAGVNLSAENI